ncbi:MAG TPA: ABC transporter ATP-binding protein [Ktedonobacterales bacterium]
MLRADETARTDERVEGADDAHVAVRHLAKRFGAHTVIGDLSFEMPRGEFLSLLGPSGSGKTTALRLIAGLARPERGSIHIASQEVFGPGGYIPAERRPVGMVFQDYALWPHMTVGENIAFPLRLRGVARDDIKRRVGELLDLVALVGLERRYPNQISGGQQQRVALARALARAPQLLLLDEPLASLDTGLREAMREEIARIVRQAGMTVINVTHDQDEAMVMSDRVMLLRDGAIQQLGAPAELYWRPLSAFVARFMGPANILSGVVAERDGEAFALTVGGMILHGRTSDTVQRSAGQRASLFCRPEDVTLMDTPPVYAENLLEGRIAQASFSAGRWKARFVSNSGLELNLSAVRESLPDGETWVAIPSQKLRLIAAEDPELPTSAPALTA